MLKLAPADWASRAHFEAALVKNPIASQYFYPARRIHLPHSPAGGSVGFGVGRMLILEDVYLTWRSRDVHYYPDDV